jgi:hypothetical protein
MQASFENSVAVLLAAYHNQTIQAMRCTSCACGELVRSALGYEIHPENNLDWIDPANPGKVVRTKWNRVVWSLAFPKEWPAEGIAQVAATGYSPSDFKDLESAFINGRGIIGGEFHLRNGMRGVINFLAAHHQVSDETRRATLAQVTPRVKLPVPAAA